MSKYYHRVRTLVFVLLLTALLIPAATTPPVVNAKPLTDGESVAFNLTPVGRFVDCFARHPGDPTKAPYAEVRVQSGKQNDRMVVRLFNFKPQLAFDLFTTERSLFQADGTPVPDFKGFGFAWYQSDIQVGGNGFAEVEINTILLNQIFGFNPDVGLAPTNTFHVGFWFNNPHDAAACGFDVNNPTPFNGEHKAGPLAMMSTPNAETNLGPLCTNPNRSTNPVSCNP